MSSSPCPSRASSPVPSLDPRDQAPARRPPRGAHRATRRWPTAIILRMPGKSHGGALPALTSAAGRPARPRRRRSRPPRRRHRREEHPAPGGPLGGGRVDRRRAARGRVLARAPALRRPTGIRVREHRGGAPGGRRSRGDRPRRGPLRLREGDPGGERRRDGRRGAPRAGAIDGARRSRAGPCASSPSSTRSRRTSPPPRMGSAVYAARSAARGEKITAMLSLEMLGAYDDREDTPALSLPPGRVLPRSRRLHRLRGERRLAGPRPGRGRRLPRDDALSLRGRRAPGRDDGGRLVRSSLVLGAGLSRADGDGHGDLPLRPLPSPQRHAATRSTWTGSRASRRGSAT